MYIGSDPSERLMIYLIVDLISLPIDIARETLEEVRAWLGGMSA